MRKFFWYGGAVFFPFLAQSSFIINHFISGIEPDFFLNLSVFVTMMQVGQASFFQSLIRRENEVKIKKRTVLAVSLFLSSFYFAAIFYGGELSELLFIALFAVANGASFSISNAHLMRDGSESLYFKRLFIRNALVITLIYAPIFFIGNCQEYYFLISIPLITAIGLIPFVKNEECCNGSYLNYRESKSAVVGATLSSIYRNDQNFVRNFSVSGGNFFAVHNCLLAGSIFQSLIGGALSTVIVPKIKSNKLDKKLISKIETSFFYLSVIFFTFSLLLDNFFLYMILGAVLLGLGQWFSIRCHLAGESLKVYLIGIFLAGTLYLVMKLGLGPEVAFFYYASFNFYSLIILNRVVSSRENK